MDANGAGQHALANDSYFDIAPALSPDGKSVAFLTSRYAAYNQLAVLDVATGGVTRVFIDSVSHGPPTWSPDGEWIGFDRQFNTCCNLGGTYKIHPDGSNLTLIAHLGADGSWSPDGSTIAHAGGNDISLLNVASGHDTSIVTGLTNIDRVEWSPDGTHIAYSHNGVVSVVHPDGSGNTDLPSPNHAWSHVGWSPDGEWLWAATNIDNTGLATNWEIYRFHIDGSGVQRMTTNGDASGGALDDWPAGGVAAP